MLTVLKLFSKTLGFLSHQTDLVTSITRELDFTLIFLGKVALVRVHHFRRDKAMTGVGSPV
jgi:hypothetical protein